MCLRGCVYLFYQGSIGSDEVRSFLKYSSTLSPLAFAVAASEYIIALDFAPFFYAVVE